MQEQGEVSCTLPPRLTEDVLKPRCRCKHLCCREGLDKPPKPGKKRSISEVQNEIPSTQLKLTSTITKGNATKASSVCVAGKPASRAHVTNNRNSARAMEEDTPIHGPAKRQRSSKEPLQETDVNIKPCRRSLSSDFTDTSLEDLPSPSLLMQSVLGASGAKGSKTAQSQSCSRGRDKGIFDFLSESDAGSQSEIVKDSVRKGTRGLGQDTASD